MNGNKKYKLNTIIYHATNHFTCSFINNDNNIWFHDGQKNKGNSILVENLCHVQISDLIESNLLAQIRHSWGHTADLGDEEVAQSGAEAPIRTLESSDC